MALKSTRIKMTGTVRERGIEVRQAQRALAGGRADPNAPAGQPVTRTAPALPFSRRGESEAFEPAFTRQAG